jgi:hypothetical protein
MRQNGALKRNREAFLVTAVRMKGESHIPRDASWRGASGKDPWL